MMPTVTLNVVQAFSTFNLSWTLEETGSGLASKTLQVGTDSPTNCSTMDPNPGTIGTYSTRATPTTPTPFPALRVVTMPRLKNKSMPGFIFLQRLETGVWGIISIFWKISEV
jgi:hypothetical protein